MTLNTSICRASLVCALLAISGCELPITTVTQAVNSFENAKATGGAALTVDVGGPTEITDDIEFPGFAFGTYDVDVTDDSLTMTLVADITQLQITQYDNTTFDRYYFEFDKEMTVAEIADTTDPNFAATVEVLEPGTTVTTAGAFVDGLGTEFTFENGSMLITIGDGTDLAQVDTDGGLTINF